ncbi:MAG: RHS repeat-associated core domain-containing protein, partial [Sedimentisphaerales bacterium]
NPFGGTLEIFAPSTVAPFRFAGQYYDTEISQYYLRARQYDPYISRFTSRDPVFGQFQEPLTLHVYLYCQNNPINKLDPKGEFPWIPVVGGALTVGAALYALNYYWDFFDIQGLTFRRIQDKDIQSTIEHYSYARQVLLDLQEENHGIRTEAQLNETLESRGVYAVGLFGSGVVGRGRELSYGQRKIIDHFESRKWMAEHPDIFSLFPKGYEYRLDPQGYMQREIEAEPERMRVVISELDAERVRRLIEMD